MKKEMNLYVVLDNEGTKLILDINNISSIRKIGIYKNKEFNVIENDDVLSKVFGFTDDEIETLFLLQHTGTINKNSIEVKQKNYMVENCYDYLKKYINSENNEPIPKTMQDKLKYLKKKTISLDEYSSLPEHIKKLYTMEYVIPYGAEIDNGNFILSLISKYQNNITSIELNAKLTSIVRARDHSLKIKAVTDNIKHIPVYIKENLSDNIDYNIIPVADLGGEFDNMFKEFDTSKLMQIQIPKEEVIEHIQHNYKSATYYHSLKPEIKKKQIKLLQTITDAINDGKSADKVKEQLNEDDLHILSLQERFKSNEPTVPNYECIYKYEYIKDTIKDYTMQNKNGILELPDVIKLLDIIINK